MTKVVRRSVQWGHLALLVFLAVAIIAYLFDARATSLRANNLLMVQPVAIFALFLVLLVLPQCFRREPRVQPPAAPASDTAAPRKETPRELAKIGVMMVAFVILAFGMERIGFDIAVFAFLVLGIYVCGERNWPANVLFSAIFTALLIYGYGAIIPFPFPLAVL